MMSSIFYGEIKEERLNSWILTRYMVSYSSRKAKIIV